MKTLIVLLLATLILATPAQADWGFTHWGDSVDTLIAAAPADTPVTAIDGRPGQAVFRQDLRAGGTSTLDGLSVDVLYFFKPEVGGLSVVKLVPQPGTDCPRFIAAARAAYGKPDVTGSVPLFRDIAIYREIWRRRADDMVLMLADVPPLTGQGDHICHVTIQPYGNGEPGIRDDTKSGNTQ